MLARGLSSLAKYAAVLGIGGSAVAASLYNVDGGERAVLFDRFRGVLPEASNEGTHFLVPWVQTAHIMDVRVRPRLIPSATGTKDLQMVEIVLRVLTRPDMDMLQTIFRNLGTDYDERVLPSITNEVLKAVVAQYNAEELLTKRDQVSEKIRLSLTKRASVTRRERRVARPVAAAHLAMRLCGDGGLALGSHGRRDVRRSVHLGAREQPLLLLLLLSTNFLLSRSRL